MSTNSVRSILIGLNSDRNLEVTSDSLYIERTRNNKYVLCTEKYNFSFFLFNRPLLPCGVEGFLLVKL
jgi:hypothetical protein